MGLEPCSDAQRSSFRMLRVVCSGGFLAADNSMTSSRQRDVFISSSDAPRLQVLARRSTQERTPMSPSPSSRSKMSSSPRSEMSPLHLHAARCLHLFGNTVFFSVVKVCHQSLKGIIDNNQTKSTSESSTTEVNYHSWIIMNRLLRLRLFDTSSFIRNSQRQQSLKIDTLHQWDKSTTMLNPNKTVNKCY